MTKERITVTVDEDVHEQLQQEYVNASGLVNELLRNYFNGGDSILEFRVEQLESEYEEHATIARQKLEKYNKLQTRLEEDKKAADVPGSTQLEKVRQVPKDPSHPLIEDMAEQTNMTPEELITEAYE